MPPTTTTTTTTKPTSSSMATTTTATATATRSNHRRDFPLALNSETRYGFSSAPSLNLKWGCQRHLRCVKSPELLSPSSSSPPLLLRKRRSSSLGSDNDDDDDNNDGGIKAVTKKLILDYRAKVDELHSAFLNVGKSPATAAASATAAAAEQRPWNLRSNPNGHISRNGSSPVRNSDDGGVGEEKGKRKMFAVSLSRKEIEMDFVAMTGARPARRPKKRPKAVQKQVDAMFPGLWLTEITADMYKVNQELPDTSKR